jgi:hypothetical protein
MATFCPSTYPVSLSPLRNAASDRLGLRVGLITGIADCCARAASGHAAAPPSPAMNSRRRISHASQPLYGSSLPQPQVSEQGASGLGTKFLRYFLQRGRPQLCRFYGASGEEIISIGTDVPPLCHSGVSLVTLADPCSRCGCDVDCRSRVEPVELVGCRYRTRRRAPATQEVEDR